MQLFKVLRDCNWQYQNPSNERVSKSYPSYVIKTVDTEHDKGIVNVNVEARLYHIEQIESFSR